jgi:carbonic anhydrase/acetyltransferase-like protein (isoleucine patch superfamily)
MPNLLPAFVILTVWLGSFSLAALPFLILESPSLPLKILAVAIMPVIFALAFLGFAAALSFPAQRMIIRGRFPRENFHRIYFWRRLYGCSWTCIYYFKPLYFVFLAIPILKTILFRSFGYKGPMKFTIYADTWIRDLPLLHFGEGSYCSNRATVGSNMCLKDGTILVDRIFIGDHVVLGHLAMIAPGVKLEKDVEIGAGAALGLRCHLYEGARIGAGSSVNHGAVIGARTEIGGHSFVGLKADLGPDLKVPAGVMIPAGAVLRNQADVDKYISSENQALRFYTQDVAEELRAITEGMSIND